MDSLHRYFWGGGWYLDASYCRSDFRGGGDPGLRYGSLGFRPIRRMR